MVSNDDVSLVQNSSKLENIMRGYSAGVTGGAFNFQVPEGKKWDIRAITMRREISAEIELILVDPVDNVVILGRQTGIMFNFQPISKISLIHPWGVRIYYLPAAAGFVQVELLVEEETEY